MTAERWHQVKTIFDGAVECDLAARTEFIRERCAGDEELRREVESLLACDQEPESLLEHPVIEAVARAASVPAGDAIVTTAMRDRLRAKDVAPLILKDRYEVERELGRGGMSVVYLARDRQLLAKRVVVKVLLDQSSIDPWIRQKFLQEMEALARIDHPGVVGVLDTGLTVEGKQFLVMQYIEGETLRGAIESGGMDFARAGGIIRQVGQALAAAHEKGVWHRDLKPENIMMQCLGGEDHVKLIDFGIAGIQNSQFTGEKTKVAGSLAYMAPEQFAGQPCAASDIYALAVVAYEILTGTLPARSGELQAKLPEAVKRSILKALSFRPELRHATVREFSEELYHALTGGEPTRRSTAPGAIEMAHVLFTDLVGYSLLAMDQQKQYLGELQQIVRDSPQFRAAEAAGDMISLPTGDGMALAFFGDPTAPAQCALEVAAGLKSKPHLKLRMGIHSGPVYRVADVNANANVAGGGINMAQRVMDCGDAGHILVSKSVADVLLQLSQWSPHLTDLGECTVKHGVKLHICNLTTAEAGNAARPRKLAASRSTNTNRKRTLAITGLLVVAAVAGALWIERANKVPQDEQSIAVLPFADLSPEKNQEWFAQGMAEELLNGLSKIPGLRVAARTSSFQFAGPNQDVRAIGKKLHVANILEGSVQKQGNQAKISTYLIKASDGFQMWSDTYSHDLNDVFAMEQQIADAVTGALQIKLGKRVPQAIPASADAYNSYLLGRYFLGESNKENLEKAVTHFTETIKLDPRYAPAWLGLGASRINQAGSGDIPADEGYKQAREAVEKALSLDPNLGEAHSALGWIQMNHDADWTRADKSNRRALVLDPGNAIVVSHAGILARIVGRFDEAAKLGRRAMQLDPLYVGVNHNAGLSLYYDGQYEESISAYRKALEIFPEYPREHCFIGLDYLALSRPQEALAEMDKEKLPALRVFGLALAYHALGKKKEADENLAELLVKYREGYLNARVYAFRGELDRAFEWLDRVLKEIPAALNQLKGDPLMKALVHDPRYTELLRKVRLPL